MKHKLLFVSMFVLLVSLLSVVIADAQGPKPGGVRAPSGGAVSTTAFTYQGQLKDGGVPVNGACDFQFGLYDYGGARIGVTQTMPSVNVANGLFTTQVDFSANAFTGDMRFLQVAVGCPSPASTFTPLSTRQQLTPAPMAFALPGLYTQQNGSSPNIIGGYSGNTVTSGVLGATISGGGANGSLNRVTDDFGTVGGGNWNQAGDGTSTTTSSYYATVGGGSNNLASGQYTTIGGGNGNEIDGYSATIGGGSSNYVSTSGNYATVGGGNGNIANGAGSFVGGGGTDGINGSGNQALANASTIAGGFGNTITTTASHGFIGGGANNTVNGAKATVSGGNFNTASGVYATVSGGKNNTASGNYSTVPGGLNNTAQGHYSFAAGYRAKANSQGSFVWADSSNFDFPDTGPDQFKVRATGGIRMVVSIDGSGNPVNNCLLNSSSGWSCTSDRNAKENFTPIDSRAIAYKVSQLPMTQWNFKQADPNIKHIGPMAQDFYAAFGLGDSDTMISTVDAQGIALTAIQGLYQIVQDKDTRITQLEKENADLKTQFSAYQQSTDARLTALEQLAQANNPVAHSDNPWNVTMIVVGALLGVVIVRRPWNGGKR